MKFALANLLQRFNLQPRTVLDVEEELLFHVEMLERKYIQLGMSADEARTAALRRFGNLERVKRQCVTISKRTSRLRRALKTSSILLILAGISIRLIAFDYRVARVGDVLIMIAIAGRFLLYVRGLSPWTFFPRTEDTSLSLVTHTLEHRTDD
jgi:hypothetical protein